MTTEQRIEDFLAQKRLAVVGVSRKEKAFSHRLFQDLWKHGYDAVPVNPNTSQCDGLPCASRVQDIVPPVGAALIMTSGKNAGSAVRDCAAAEVKRVWIPIGAGKNPLSRNDLEFCKENAVQLTLGFCPYMFLPNRNLLHNFHGWIARLSGSYHSEN